MKTLFFPMLLTIGLSSCSEKEFTCQCIDEKGNVVSQTTIKNTRKVAKSECREKGNEALFNPDFKVCSLK